MGPAWLSGDCHGLESESWDQYLAGEPQVSQRELACPQGPTMGSRHAGAQPLVTVLTLLSASVPCSRTPLSSPPPPHTVQGGKRPHLSPERTWLVLVSDAGFQLWSSPQFLPSAKSAGSENDLLGVNDKGNKSVHFPYPIYHCSLCPSPEGSPSSCLTYSLPAVIPACFLWVHRAHAPLPPLPWLLHRPSLSCSARSPRGGKVNFRRMFKVWLLITTSLS